MTGLVVPSVQLGRLGPIVLAAGLTGCFGGGGHSATPSFTGEATNCSVPPREYTPSLSPSHGPPGTTVVMTGALPVRNEAGDVVLSEQTTKLEGWWNLNPRKWETALTKDRGPVAARSGPVRRVLSIAVPRPAPCRYDIPFTVPESKRGSYPVLLIYFGGGGASGGIPAIFTVTE